MRPSGRQLLRGMTRPFRRVSQLLTAFMVLGVGLLLLIPAWDSVTENLNVTPASPEIAPVTMRFEHCGGAAKSFCVVDGDTIRVGGVKIRIADIDTPEIFSFKCAAEAALGHQASDRLLVLLNAGPIELQRYGSRDVDRYGRKLRVVVRDGQSLGGMLVDEGLARQWDGARHSWCK